MLHYPCLKYFLSAAPKAAGAHLMGVGITQVSRQPESKCVCWHRTPRGSGFSNKYSKADNKTK